MSRRSQVRKLSHPPLMITAFASFGESRFKRYAAPQFDSRSVRVALTPGPHDQSESSVLDSTPIVLFHEAFLIRRLTQIVSPHMFCLSTCISVLAYVSSRHGIQGDDTVPSVSHLGCQQIIYTSSCPTRIFRPSLPNQAGQGY
jgi:hypothetical protein